MAQQKKKSMNTQRLIQSSQSHVEIFEEVNTASKEQILLESVFNVI